MRADVDKCWVQQLCREYDNICYQHKLTLRRPLITLDDSTSRLGQWDPSSRTLSISRHILENHPWHVVVNVLRHEIAHQIVTEIFLADDAGHGTFFSQACSMVAVPAEFAKAAANLNVSIPDWRTHTAEGETALLRKVEKLLSLASSSNENEAYLAMQRVQELIAKYNLEDGASFQGSSSTRDYVTCVIETGRQRLERTHKLICSLLTSFYFVEVVLTQGFDTKSLKSNVTIDVMGTRTNVLMAEFVYHFLLQQVESLWKTYQKAHTIAGNQRLSYQDGILRGFQDKLQNFSATGSTTVKDALVALKHDKKLKNFVKSRFPRIERRSTGRHSVYEGAFEAGRAAGERIVIHKPLEERKQTGRFLLGRG